MASEDDYTFAARQRLQRISAERAQALADLQVAKANGDIESMGDAEEALAAAAAREQNLVALHQQYVASQTPARPPEPSKEERAARNPDKMDWVDVLNIAKNSKYGKNLDFNDPHFVAGYNEVLARRARGE